MEECTPPPTSARPRPFIRELRWQMDNCAATSKSRFCFGGLAFLILLGQFDAVDILFLVVGHTKFRPDDLARAIAGAHQELDTFNFGMLMQYILTYSCGEAYDGTEILREIRTASDQLFTKVEKIMSFRVFYIVADDGQVDMGEARALPAGVPEMPTNGPIYALEKLQEQLGLLMERSLVNVMADVFARRFQGIGSGSGDYGPAPDRLLPSSTSTFRTPRHHGMRHVIKRNQKSRSGFFGDEHFQL